MTMPKQLLVSNKQKRNSMDNNPIYKSLISLANSTEDVIDIHTQASYLTREGFVKQNWIDVNKEEPQEDFSVIASCADDVEVCIFRVTDNGFYFEDSNGEEFHATHWMNKPSPA